LNGGNFRKEIEKMNKWLILILFLFLPFVLAPIIVPHFNDAVLWIYDNADGSKRLKFELNGITTGNTRTITMPDSDVTLLADENNVLSALASLPVVADNEFIVGTGACTYAHENPAGTNIAGLGDDSNSRC